MGKPEDIPQWAWEKARGGIPPVYFKMEGMSPTLHVLRVGIAKAILSAVEEENEACALEALRWQDGIDAAEHIRRRNRKGA